MRVADIFAEVGNFRTVVFGIMERFIVGYVMAGGYVGRAFGVAECQNKGFEMALSVDYRIFRIFNFIRSQHLL